ncbi:MFS transporter [Leuconostoc gelidum subsp. gelidum]|uniref:MFS transporter n=1 Tax=Leuconostoc gelidum subsp. gelidum TaxID=1607839 RepID=A0AB35G0H8_LEUGE|nr:MFS transporter [Leuconostoc gelidum]MBZ5963558.1 MFS transporter [Leuconostoc gelidum subsp. gelidum]MBZ5975600.1 MFS transporter [Leuconostoc gelidum subsp. gelidum]MBZ5976232.1 MFS transporter [Leuconostoc gelidum subsp. gelidum]MBZ5987015.1 MFS transporter [Leuconostoc gelidum subsp. gelidum]MBZ6000133.1 MFS transporter [Leuconostoc gelidum subsp. gelidum]
MFNTIIKTSLISLVFNLAITSLNFFFGLYFLQITRSAFIFGTLTIIGPLVSLMLTPIMTRIVDTGSHKKILLIAQIISFVFLVVYWVVVRDHLGVGTLSYVYILMIIIRVSEELFIVTLKASTTQLVEKYDYQRLNASVQSATSVANILGPIVGGLAFSLLTLPFFISLIIFLVGMSILFTRTLKLAPLHRLSATDKNSFLMVIKFVKARPEILSLVIIAMFINLFASSITIGLPVLVIKQLSLSKLVYSFLESLTSVAMVGGGILLTVHTIKNNLKMMYQSMLCFTIIIVLFGFPELITRNYLIIIGFLGILVVVFGLIVVVANTAMTTYLQIEVPENKQGGVYSIINAISQLFIPLGGLCYGLLFDRFESYQVFISSGLVAFVIIIGLLLLTKKRIIKRI